MIKFILKYNLSLYNILAIIWLSIQIHYFESKIREDSNNNWKIEGQLI